ncbi:hypothetical protein JDW15_02230 [Aerococcaceae bacterium zg-ZJ1578]|uniref:hypothetical protein n=1 Tax=Aerococcaceae bacterium zg-252 TaxID=2796928 RepID=UPI001A1C0A13|nr:hypothetical protein [Aerococcaceae bacterium zg-1578]
MQRKENERNKELRTAREMKRQFFGGSYLLSEINQKLGIDQDLSTLFSHSL